MQRSLPLGHNPRMSLFANLVAVSQRVGATSARLAKVRELAACLRAVEPSEIDTAVHYLSGELPQGRFGIGYTTLRKASERSGVAATATLTIQRSILANTSTAPDCRAISVNGGAFSTAGSADNLIENNNGCTGIVQTADPNLAPLALNAPGTTMTHAPNSGSPAIDAVLGACPPEATDQRGRLRTYPFRDNLEAFFAVVLNSRVHGS